MAIEIWRPRGGLRRAPFPEPIRMEREMEEMFGRFFGGWPWGRREAEGLGWTPAIDVLDRPLEQTEETAPHLEAMEEFELKIYTNSEEKEGMERLSTEEIARRLVQYDHVLPY